MSESDHQQQGVPQYTFLQIKINITFEGTLVWLAHKTWIIFFSYAIDHFNLNVNKFWTKLKNGQQKMVL
jgi:hypothetical protein